MPGKEDLLLLLIVALVQVGGLAGMAIARLSEKWERHTFCYTIFFVSMALVASTALMAASTGSGYWLLSGTTLSVMVIGATLDCGGCRTPT